MGTTDEVVSNIMRLRNNGTEKINHSKYSTAQHDAVSSQSADRCTARRRNAELERCYQRFNTATTILLYTCCMDSQGHNYSAISPTPKHIPTARSLPRRQTTLTGVSSQFCPQQSPSPCFASYWSSWTRWSVRCRPQPMSQITPNEPHLAYSHDHQAITDVDDRAKPRRHRPVTLTVHRCTQFVENDSGANLPFHGPAIFESTPPSGVLYKGSLHPNSNDPIRASITTRI